MTKITTKFITENIKEMVMFGKHIIFRGNEYWVRKDTTDEGQWDAENGTIYRLTKDELTMGVVNGREYGKIINGVPYKI